MSATAVALHGQSTAIEAPRPALLRPIAAPAEIIEAQNAAREMVHKALVEGRDYGAVPGTDKPTMLKPGAERVALGFGCYYGTPEILEREVDHNVEVHWHKTKWVKATKPANWQELKDQGVGRNRKVDGQWQWQERADERGVSLGLYRYVVRVPVINRATGEAVGSGVGSCSSMESKYIDRPRDSENTVLKMAFKRAMVAACLTTFGLSDEFTQDVEDLPHMTGDAGQGSEPVARPNEQEIDAEVEEEAPLTLALALAMPLPGSKTAWNGKGGTPLGQLDAKMVPAIRKWIHKKIEEGEQQNTEVPSGHYRLRSACDLILEWRKADAEKTQTTMELGGAPAAAAPSGGSVAMPAPGKVEDAIAPSPAMRERAATITKLLEHEKLAAAADDRAVFVQRLAKADTLEALQLLQSDVEQYLELPF